MLLGSVGFCVLLYLTIPELVEVWIYTLLPHFVASSFPLGSTYMRDMSCLSGLYENDQIVFRPHFFINVVAFFQSSRLNSNDDMWRQLVRRIFTSLNSRERSADCCVKVCVYASRYNMQVDTSLSRKI